MSRSGSTAADVWWRQPFRMFQTNLREIDAGLDVDRVADYIADFGANVWLLSIGGIVSNYPTKLDFQTANPALANRPSGDLVGDAIAAAAERGIRVVGRMDFSKIDHRRFEQRPDWCFVNDRGEHQVYNGLVSTCPSADYYQERIFDVVTEVLSGYDVAGFFFNWMSYNEVDYSRRYWGVCQCLACRRRFANFAPGTELPTGPDSETYNVWRQFAQHTLDDLTGRMTAHIHELRSDAALVLGDRADIAFHESNNAVGRPLWHHHTCEAVSIATSLRPPRPVLVNSVGFVDMPYRLAGEDPRHFRQYLIQTIARGGNPSTYIMGTPDDSPYACLDDGREITRFHRDHAASYAGLVSAAAVLLVRPDPLDYSAHRLPEVLSEYEGVYLALLENHIPFDVATSAKLPNLSDHGSRYAIAILPDLGVLDVDSVHAVDTFCGNGGIVLCTGSTAFDGDRMQLANGPIARRLSSYETAESTRSLVLTTEDTGHRWGNPIPVIGGFHVVEPAGGADSGLNALSRAPYGPPEKCYGHLETPHPGRVSSSDGRVAVLPWTVGRVYRELGIRAARDLIAQQVVELAGPGVQLSTDLPEQVEIVSGHNNIGPIVHLLNRSGDAPQRFMTPLPIRSGTVQLSVNQPIAAVQGLRSGQAVAFSQLSDAVIELEVPPLADFEVLQLLDRSVPSAAATASTTTTNQPSGSDNADQRHKEYTS